MSSLRCSVCCFRDRFQRRTVHAQASGFYDAVIVPMKTVMKVQDKATGDVAEVEVTVTKGECNRPGTTLESASLGVPTTPLLWVARTLRETAEESERERERERESKVS